MLGNAAWYLADRQGSIRDIVNLAGATVLDHRAYDAFGNITAESSPSNGDWLGYNGGYMDVASGYIKFGARWYDPSTGGWTTRDPSGFGGGDYNLSRYVGNGPTDGTDPTGLRYFNGDAALKAGVTAGIVGMIIGSPFGPEGTLIVGAIAFSAAGLYEGFAQAGDGPTNDMQAVNNGAVIGAITPFCSTQRHLRQWATLRGLFSERPAEIATAGRDGSCSPSPSVPPKPWEAFQSRYRKTWRLHQGVDPTTLKIEGAINPQKGIVPKVIEVCRMGQSWDGRTYARYCMVKGIPVDVKVINPR